MGKVEEFMKRAAEFEALAAEAQSDGLRASYAMVAQSYRRLADFIAKAGSRSAAPQERQ
jgi:hypothetical protein